MLYAYYTNLLPELQGHRCTIVLENWKGILEIRQNMLTNNLVFPYIIYIYIYIMRVIGQIIVQIKHAYHIR
jgi:hypothetical protein